MRARVRLVVERVLIVALIAYAIVVVRDFARYADHYPYLAVDDAVANVSYAIATEGRNGFLASPVQGFTDLTRHRGFFGYGPWYFDVGAGLIWLLGYNLSMLRGLHLAGILAIAAAACWWFSRRGAFVSGALLSLGIMRCFDVSQWPMVRPDIAVSVFASMFVVAAGLAIEKPHDKSALYWGLAGLGAGAAAFSHLIAWALVPCCLVVLATVLATERPPQWLIVRAVLALGLGLISAAAMFYASSGFRVLDHVASLTAYQQFLTDAERRSGDGFVVVLGEHLRIAFAYLTPAGRALLGASVAVSFLMLIGSWLRPPAARRRAMACLLPPMAVLLCYALSLGRYPNYHAGYAILIQVGAWWCAAAALCVAIDWIAERSTMAAIVPAGVAVLLIFMAGLHLANRSEAHARLQRVNEWVSIRDFTHEVSEPIPVAATAWGSIFFGIENPGRLQLIQLAEGLLIMEQRRRDAAVNVEQVAPDYLLWGYPESRDNTLQLLRGAAGAATPMLFSRLSEYLPAVNYRLTNLVVAPPYGVTRVFSKTARSDRPAPEPPSVSAYNPVDPDDPRKGTWDRRVEGPLVQRFSAATPVTFELGDGTNVSAAVRADRSVVADAPVGRLLIQVRVGVSQGATRRVLAVTPTPSWREVITELGPRVDFAPYFEHDGHVYLVHEHAGGPLYISQFDNGRGASIDGVDLFFVRPRLDSDPRSHLPFLDMPALRSWIPLASAGVQARMAESGTLVVDGDSTSQGYQIKSPPVWGGADSRVDVRTAFQGTQGTVCVGALNATEKKWLATAGDPSRGIRFTLDDTGAFQLVFYNCSTTERGNVQSRFTVSRPRYSIEPAALYVDRLLSVLDSAPKTEPAAPDPRVRSFPPGLAITPDQLARPATPLSRADLESVAPIAQSSGDGWAIKGRAEGAYTYVLVSKPQNVIDGGRLVAMGRVDTGGVTVGLIRNNQWAGQVNVTSPGEFVAVVEPPNSGSYRVVVANNVGDPSLQTDVVISRIGWIPR